MSQQLPELANLEAWWTSRRPSRIIVVGPSGSGKTTLARKLAQLLKCTAVDIDEHYWLPGWKGREQSDFYARLEAAIADDAWTLSGNYHRTHAMTWPRADLVIWLDFSLALSLSRVTRRCIRRALSRELVCNGNRESLRMTFLSKDSLLMWVLKTHARHRKGYRAKMGGNPPILRLRGPGDVARLHEKLWLLERPSKSEMQPEAVP